MLGKIKNYVLNSAITHMIMSLLFGPRPGYFYLFREKRDWNSRDNLKIFGKVRKFWAAQTSNDVHKSAAIASFQTINENKSRFPKSFWCEGSENYLTAGTYHTYICM